MSRSSGLDLPLPDVNTLLLIGGGLVLLVPGPDGQNLIGRIGGAVAAANATAGAVGNTANAAGQTAAAAGQGIGSVFSAFGTWLSGVVGGAPGAAVADPNQNLGANGGNDTFSINTDPKVSQVFAFALPVAGGIGVMKTHVGVGHIGTGGTFTCILWGQASGVAGAFQSDPTWIAQKNFDVGHDGQWNGYGIDFTNNMVPISPVGLSVWAQIVAPDGSQFTQQNLAVFVG